MPMVPEAVVAMLACARIGAVHSVVFGGFAPNELAVRIDDARPKVIVSASCGIEPTRVVEYKPIIDRALEIAEHRPGTVVVKQRPEAEATLTASATSTGRRAHGGRDAAGRLRAGRGHRPALHPLHLRHHGPAQGRRARQRVATPWRWPGRLANIYDVRPGDVWWTASDVGWVVGHSYIVYAPLLAGGTTVLYEGKPVGTPDAGAFWRVIAEHRVKALFTAPTAFRAIKKEDPTAQLLAGHDLSAFRTCSSPGSAWTPTPTTGRPTCSASR